VGRPRHVTHHLTNIFDTIAITIARAQTAGPEVTGPAAPIDHRADHFCAMASARHERVVCTPVLT